MVLEIFPVGMLQCNCTLLGDEATGEAMVIDPGDNVADILKRLAAHKLKLKQIVVTHAHIDHVGGALQLKRATGAPILLNENDLPLLDMMDVQADASRRVSGRVQHFGLVVGNPHHHSFTHVLVRSISLHFAPEKLLLAGDTLFAGSIGRTDLPGGDRRQLLFSIHDKLMVLPDETRVIPGHEAETTIGAERETNPWFKGWD